MQYRVNVWNRGIFDALDKRDGAAVAYQSMIFFPLILISVAIAAAVVILLFATISAVLVPARRAVRVSPAQLLKQG